MWPDRILADLWIQVRWGEKVLTQCTGWEMMLRSRQPPCEHRGDESGPVGLGCLGWHLWPGGGSLSLIQPWRCFCWSCVWGARLPCDSERGSSGQPRWVSVSALLGPLVVTPTGCAHFLSICRPDTFPRFTEAALQSGRMASHSPVSPWPLSTLQESVPSLLTFNIGPVGVGGSFCVLCDVFLHFRLPVRWWGQQWLQIHSR